MYLRLNSASFASCSLRSRFEREAIRQVNLAPGKVAFQMDEHVVTFGAIRLAQRLRSRDLDGVLVGRGDGGAPSPDRGRAPPFPALVHDHRVFGEAADDGLGVVAVRRGQILADHRWQRSCRARSGLTHDNPSSPRSRVTAKIEVSSFEYSSYVGAMRVAQKIRLEDRECPLSATLGLVGEWWTLLILHDAFDGYSRFDQFQENLGISSSLLTSRLKRMVGAGLLERRQYQANPARYEYLLTELGRSLRPVVVVLAAWGNTRLAPHERSMVLVDAQTGAEAEPVLVDRATGRRVDGPDFVFTAGPAASRPFQDRYIAHPKLLQP